MKGYYAALGLSLVGGFTFAALNLPLPWLLGPMSINMVASMGGLPVQIPTRVRNFALAVLGVSLGSAFSPEFVARAGEWTISLSSMVLYLAAVSPLAIFYLRRFVRFDRITAATAGIPGGFGEMVMLGASLGADPRPISLAHASRLVTILVLVPPMLRYFSDVDTSGYRTVTHAAALTLPDIAILIVCGTLGPVLAKRLRLPAAVLLGALILSAIIHIGGFTSAKPPDWVNATVQLIIGAWIGARFAGAVRTEVTRILVLSIGLTSLILLLTVLFVGALHQVSGLPFLPLLLAFIPGGIAEMSLVSLTLNIDPVFVAAHHSLRVSIIFLCVPFLVRWIR